MPPPFAPADGFVLLEESTVIWNPMRGLGVRKLRLAVLIQGELRRDARFRPLAPE
ncbi:MAG: hypothetical protein Q6L19_09685 [Gloeomargarita sp. GMQP_bins_69]